MRLACPHKQSNDIISVCQYETLTVTSENVISRSSTASTLLVSQAIGLASQLAVYFRERMRVRMVER